MYPRRKVMGAIHGIVSIGSKSCRYRWGDGSAEISRKKPILANRMDIAWENAIVQMATDYPAYGQLLCIERVA